MTEQKDFLVELGTEELPPKALRRLAEAFRDGVTSGLDKEELRYGDVRFFAAPRRLAVMVEKLDVHQADKLVERRGPALQAAFKEDGCPTPAAEGFARSCGVDVSALETFQNDKGAWLVHKSMQAGQSTAALLPGIIEKSLAGLPIPKRMRWADSDHEFVRPVHWLVMLFGNDVVPASLFGHASRRESFGHRFHRPLPLEIPNPEAYEVLLETEGHVIASFETRRCAIKALVEEAALTVSGVAQIDNDLLDEVTGLVEWPVAIVGRFEERFLEVPAEALISAMKGHQKYFHVTDSSGKLLPCFITVSNIDSKNPESVRRGNERVIRPRLADADFFWNQDRKTPLHKRRDTLRDVVFQNKLGSVFDKTERVAVLAAFIADKVNGNNEDARRAAALSKCDLLTNMVGEFPELQGTMGQYYAKQEGENPEVAAALFEQYLPRFAGDNLPTSATGQALAIADKLDTLVGIFGIGQRPTGDKDPFALRRASLGILRIIIEQELPLDLKELISTSKSTFAKNLLASDTHSLVFDFMLERLRSYYYDQSVSADVFDAVHATLPTKPLDFDRRVRAVMHFRSLPEADSLAAANKRIGNILKKAEVSIPGNIERDLMSDIQEIALFEEYQILKVEVSTLTDKGDYQGALKLLARLKNPVDAFFDHVMVMVDDQAVRGNRLALLDQLSRQFLRIADISKLQTT